MTERRLSDLIDDVDNGRLTVRPFFQRRLVWTNDDKELLIDTILRGYPFPEIFVATGDLDLRTHRRVNWVVDGQQRLTTIKNYLTGTTELLYKTVSRFADLPETQQRQFLDYQISVRDLGGVDEATVREIFRRINSTDYALKSMEVLNAMFSGVYKKYCEELSREEFFVRHHVFSAAVQKRMYDITFCVILVTTVLSGYYRRDELNEEYLQRYNDEFPMQDAIQTGLDVVFDFVERCEIPPDARMWHLTDLLTVLVELYVRLVTQKRELDPALVGPILNTFFFDVDSAFAGEFKPPGNRPWTPEMVSNYLKAATKASNDKYARVERAQVIGMLLELDSFDPEASDGAALPPDPSLRQKVAARKKRPSSKSSS